MATNQEKLQQKYNDIEKMYEKLSSKKVNGKTLYSHDAILELIAEKFYLSPSTINSILTRLK